MEPKSTESKQIGRYTLIQASRTDCDIARLLLETEAEDNTVRQDGETALMLASQNGHCDIVRLLLESGAEVNIGKKDDGWTALMVASWYSRSDIVRLLLEREAEVNRTTKDGSTALVLASQNGHCDIVRLLLKSKAEVNRTTKDGSTALMLASENGHCDIVRLLLERSAEVNISKEDGWTTLMVASQKGHCDIVRLLLERGAEVNRTTKDGWTALIVASWYGHCDIVRLLLERGAGVNTVAQDGRTALIQASQKGHCDIVRLLLVREAEVNRATKGGWTALMLASWYNHCDIVRLLLDKSADVNKIKEDGWTALMVASQNGHCDIARLLLEKQPEVNRAEGNCWTALILASENGHCDTVRLLLDRGAEVNRVAQDCSTALKVASQNGHCDIVGLLLERGAEVNTVTWDGRTALMLASQKGNCDTVRLLLERGAEVNTVIQDGRTTLMAASQNGHCDTVRLLLERGAEVNTVTQDGRTALILASHNGHCDIVRLLLEREAEVNTVTWDGRTALMLASQKGHCDIVRLLLERRAEVNTATPVGDTALLLASHKGHWSIVTLLIGAGANVSHVNKYGEIAAMYILFAITTKKCVRQLGQSIKNAWQNPDSPKSHYGMSNASFALVGALLYNTQSEWFDCQFAKSSLLEDLMYVYLPNIFHQDNVTEKYLFSPYQGVEGKISLHTMATAVVCKLPHTVLLWLTVQHRDKLINMLGQTPLHLLAMENHILHDMGEKILLLTETVGFSFSDRDNNGRVPYHIACLCLNAQFLQCGLRLDSDFTANMLVQDHLVKIPIEYMANLLYNETESCSNQSLKLLSATKTPEILMQSIGSEFAMNMERKTCTDPRLSNNTVDSLRKYFKANMTVPEVYCATNRVEKNLLGMDDIACLFRSIGVGIVSFLDMQHVLISVMNLLQLIGNEMGIMDPLFGCVPELKGSVQENTKCGELDELDTSMKLVKFEDYFCTHIYKHGIEMRAKIVPKACNRYWICGESGMFSSIEFCTDFWQILLKALGNEVIQRHIKRNGLIIENCKRKHGFVGMLNISCQLGDRFKLISVDITPSIVGDNLDGYTALLRPRHYDNKEVGLTSCKV